MCAHRRLDGLLRVFSASSASPKGTVAAVAAFVGGAAETPLGAKTLHISMPLAVLRVATT